jgi:molecular chaperone HscB
MEESKTASAVKLEPASRQRHSCWSCGDMRAAQFCAACGKVQQPSAGDYFSFFNLPRKLDLNLAQLERDFHELSRHLHPDLNARSSEQEQAWSLEMSSLLNDAYRTLRDPVERTAYLLKIEGLDIEGQSKRATEAARASGQVKRQSLPPEMLEEVFELNMQLEEARANGSPDEAGTAALEATLAHWKERRKALLEELHECWRQWDAMLVAEKGFIDLSARQKLLERMMQLLNRHAYIRNILRDINEVLGM